MKSSKILSAFITVLVLCSSAVFGQTINNIPPAVVSAFTAKYPNAEIKKWSADPAGFTARAKVDHETIYASFDKDGAWVNTASKIGLSKNLPAEVLTSFKTGKYAAWRIDGIKKIEAPGKEFYQVCVDNGYLQSTADEAMVFTQNKVLNFNVNGGVFAVKDISSPLLF